MNRFELRRVAWMVDLGGATPQRWDLAVPIIDGTPLAERFAERAPGTWTALIAAPSQHWLGVPENTDSDGRAEVLTGTCGEAGCCGVFARIEVTEAHVRWRDLRGRGAPAVTDGLEFSFDRSTYEAAIAAVALQPLASE